ncbi:imidazole glycerol phosphate synthase subunit HisF, partial [Vibrio anguillarum]
MLKKRVIPVLLLQDGGLVKGEKFKKHKYVGDPINAVRIFNEKEVDELAFVDISVGVNRGEPDYELIGDMASEAF